MESHPDASSPAALIDFVWTEVELPEAQPGRWSLSGVVDGPDGFVVFGSIGDQSIAWSSPDGGTWASATLPGIGATPSEAASTLEATVLLGVGSTDGCAHESGAVLWRRGRDAVDWILVPFDGRLFCAGGLPRLAASEVAFAVAGTGAGQQPFSWRSADGRQWLDASSGLSLDAPPALIASTTEGFLSIGRGSTTDVHLLSQDGWLAVAAPPVPAAFDGQRAGVEPGALLTPDAGPLAFFQTEEGAMPSGWQRQADGSWAQIGLAGIPGGFFHGGATIRGVPFIVVFDGQWSKVLTSTDLANWVEVTTPRLSSIAGMATFGDRIVIAGDKDPVGKGMGNQGVFVADLHSG